MHLAPLPPATPRRRRRRAHHCRRFSSSMIAATSGQRGGLLGRPEATIFMNVGFARAFEFLPPTQIASFENSGSLICIGGHGG